MECDTHGLSVDADPGNNLEVDPDSKFHASRITVKGEGNTIVLKKSRSYKSLTINLRGNNKRIEISKSDKNINNLKIVSIRGDGQSVFIGCNLSLGGMELQMNDGNENVVIGDNCLFSWGIKIRTSDGHSIIDLNTGLAVNLPRDVVIGDRVWVGEDVRFLKGAAAPPDTVVASNSVVTKAFPNNYSNCVIGGNPAGVLKTNISWDRRKPSEYNSNKRCE